MSGKYFKKIRKEEKDTMKAAEDEHQQRLDRCIPIAKKVLTIVAEGDSYLGDVVDKLTGQPKPDALEKYNGLAKKILELMLAEGALLVDREFIFQLALQAISLTKEKVLNSLDRSLERAESILFGKDILDLSLADIDKILKEKN